MNKIILLLSVCVAIVFSIGILMVFNTTSAEVLNKSLQTSTHTALIKQLVYGCIGAIIGVLIWFVGYKKIIDFSPFFLFSCIVLLALVFVPGIGQIINGARRWIGFSGYTIQPSEFAKYLIPLYFIYRITKHKESLDIKNFIIILAFFSIPILLILLEPDTGTTIIVIMTLVFLFFLTKIKMIYWAMPLIIFTIVGGAIAYNMPHVPNRIKIYLHPELDLKGKGHQPYQAKIAVGSGKIIGRGFGESLQKLDYLPEARNDYIAAIYAEETGFLGICLLIALYMCIAYSGFYIAAKSQDVKGFYLATILTFLICFQAFLNLGVVSALLPSKGITLPFFSQGGTSLIVNIIAVSLLLSIAKEEVLSKRCPVKRRKRS
ncbi:MAG: putative lipid II flippase FtsW [Parachlamydiales bacterium]|nr:putative lipid II flippase FtsW [Parachlamydiales bacterium]